MSTIYNCYVWFEYLILSRDIKPVLVEREQNRGQRHCLWFDNNHKSTYLDKDIKVNPDYIPTRRNPLPGLITKQDFCI